MDLLFTLSVVIYVWVWGDFCELVDIPRCTLAVLLLLGQMNEGRQKKEAGPRIEVYISLTRCYSVY